MKNTFYLFLALFLCYNVSNAQLNTELLAEMDYSQNLSDVWGYTAPDGTEYALVGVRNGLSIVSLDDPENPEEVAFVPGDNSIWRDIKTWGDHAYVVADQGNDGMTVIDLSNLPNSVSSSQWTPNISGLGTLTRCHNLYIDENGKAFLTGCNLNSGGPFVVDVFTDPDNPAYIDKATTVYAHDVFVQDDILYSSEIYVGNVSMYDVSDLSNVTLLGTQNTPLDFTHNAWANEDGSVVFTTDERANAPTAAYDLSDYNNIELLDEFRPLNSLGSGVIPHNVHFRDDYLILSSYTDGVIVMDALDPSNIIEVGNYDTWSGSDGGFSGAWGAYPFFDTDKILVSDISNGLFVLDATYTTSAKIEGKVTDFITGGNLNNVDVEILSSQLNATKTNASGDYKTGQEQGGLFSVSYSKSGYLTHIQEEVLVKGESIIVDVQLVPLTAVFSASGTVTETPGGAPIEGAKLVLQNENYYFVTTSNANGEFTFPQVVQGDYDLIGGNWGHLHNKEENESIFNNTSALSIELNKGYQDDFIADLGWTIEDFADDGNWVLAEPRGTMANGNQANPEVDITGDYGDRAYVTGNGGVTSTDDDLDGGPSNLISPTMDLSVFNQPILHYNAWFFNNISGSSNDFYDITLNNGSQMVLLESISNSTPGWESRTFDLNELITSTDDMNLDLGINDTGSDHVIEAALDGFWVEEGTPFVDFSVSIEEGCGPLGVQFTDNNNNAVAWVWDFDGASPTSSTDQNPFVSFESPGFYSVSLQIQTWDGQTHSVTMEDLIHVLDFPVADFDFTIDGSSVDFENNSTGYNSSEWDFGDDQTSNEDSPIHVYEADGEYTVTLMVTNDCGTAGMVQELAIATLPTANFTSNSQSGCVPLEIEYENQSSGNSETYLWTFEGGLPGTSNEVNPIVSYNQQGLFDVTLIASNEVGNDTLTMENFIGASDIPSASFSFQVNGSEVLFNNSSADAFSFEWLFGDGSTSTDEDASHIYEEDGLYEVTLIAFNACGSDTMALNIEISNYPIAGFSSDQQSGCVELTVHYTNESSDNSDSWLWTFEGGIPVNSTEENPTVSYSVAGLYDVTLIAINELGSDTLTFENFVGVSDIPEAHFSFETAARAVNFVNTSTGALNYEWQFGDGNSSNDENTNHEYASDGLFEVLLIASNGCGPDTIKQFVEINTPPIAGFESDITSACLPQLIQFTDLSSENTDSWNWTFEGGFPENSVEQNPVVSYGTEGVYSVDLIVSNETGIDTISFKKYITINDVPSVSFDHQIDDFDISVSNQSTNYTSISWDFGDGTMSTQESVNHTYQNEGLYTVTLIGINECGSDTQSVMINASLLPTAGFSSSQSSACVPAEIQFNDLSSANVIEWQWSFEGGFPENSVEQNPLISYAEVGTYNVELIVKSLAGSDTMVMTGYITINDIPTAGFDSSIQDKMVNFENQSSNYTMIEWDFGDGDGSNETDPAHEYLEDGNYIVLLIATNECGKDSFMADVKVSTLPTALFMAETLYGCAPLEVNFMNNSSSNASTFEWTFDGGNPMSSNEKNPTVTYNDKGLYNVQLIVGSEAGFDTLLRENYIVIDDVPESSFSLEMNLLEVTFTNETAAAFGFEWDFGDGESSIEINPVHTYNEAGEYIVRLISFNECGPDTVTQTLTVSSTSIYELGVDFNIIIKPNPFQDVSIVEYDVSKLQANRLEFNVFDAYGRKLDHIKLNSSQGQIEIAGQFQPGMYFIALSSGEELIWMEKLIKI
jgi:choice-of-anchor B domain-containing protein